MFYLISNAFKYSEELNPKLNVNYKEEGVEITVKDYGIGMSQEDLKNIFLPFHRADNVANIEGTGLGLTIVKEYVELNDGEIEVQSELKQGSTFSIKLRYWNEK